MRGSVPPLVLPAFCPSEGVAADLLGSQERGPDKPVGPAVREGRGNAEKDHQHTTVKYVK